MRALRVREHGEPTAALALEQVPSPAPTAGEARVRVGAATLGLPDVFLCRGEYQLHPPLPFTPGLEAAGVVVAVGDDGDADWVGRRVVGVPTLPSGAFAEETILPVRALHPVPDEVPDDLAAASHISHTTAHVALHRRVELRAGQTLLVHAAAGGTGSAAVQLGRLAGARVIATAGSEARARVCTDLGADVALSSRDVDLVAAVRDATAGRGADVVFDPVGGDLFRMSQRCVASEGTILVIGFAGGEIQQVPANRVLLGNYAVSGLYMGAYARSDAGRAVVRAAHEELMGLIGSGRLTPLVSGDLTLADVPGGLERLRDRDVVGRLVARPA